MCDFIKLLSYVYMDFYVLTKCNQIPLLRILVNLRSVTYLYIKVIMILNIHYTTQYCVHAKSPH